VYVTVFFLVFCFAVMYILGMISWLSVFLRPVCLQKAKMLYEIWDIEYRWHLFSSMLADKAQTSWASLLEGGEYLLQLQSPRTKKYNISSLKVFSKEPSGHWICLRYQAKRRKFCYSVETWVPKEASVF
jgi:hypothetical protein